MKDSPFLPDSSNGSSSVTPISWRKENLCLAHRIQKKTHRKENRKEVLSGISLYRKPFIQITIKTKQQINDACVVFECLGPFFCSSSSTFLFFFNIQCYNIHFHGTMELLFHPKSTERRKKRQQILFQIKILFSSAHFILIIFHYFFSSFSSSSKNVVTFLL